VGCSLYSSATRTMMQSTRIVPASSDRLRFRRAAGRLAIAGGITRATSGPCSVLARQAYSKATCCTEP